MWGLPSNDRKWTHWDRRQKKEWKLGIFLETFSGFWCHNWCGEWFPVVVCSLKAVWSRGDQDINLNYSTFSIHYQRKIATVTKESKKTAPNNFKTRHTK